MSFSAQYLISSNCIKNCFLEAFVEMLLKLNALINPVDGSIFDVNAAGT